jgi:nucleotide-binding universal stress UspA family protein
MAKEKNAGIIILGTHGKTGIDRLLMGSVVERTIALAQCAVLVTKRK